MSSDDFQTLQAQLRQARQQSQRAQQALFILQEKQKKIETRLSELKRRFDPENETHQAEQKRLQAQEKELSGQISKANTALTSSSRLLNAASERFVPLSDPREQISMLNDAYPVLLMPLRLELRFRQVQQDSRNQGQLWVRVYPDDCAIDTFEEVLSENEVRNVRQYWARVWQAGSDENLLRAAWRNLVASHGVGRALWIIENYRPTGDVKAPERDEKTVVLVITATQALPEAAHKAMLQFWEAVWRAHDDATALAKAQAQLVDKTNEGTAERIIEGYRPFNLDEAPPAAAPSYTDAKVIVAVIQFESEDETATKRQSWSRAPQVSVLPDRLVLMAYSGDTLVLEAVGNFIPSPLIAGPDPLAEEGEDLHQEGDDIVLSPAMRWMADFDEAVRVGMAFRVNLTPQQFAQGFDKLMVLGVRLSEDEAGGQDSFEQLLKHHHYSRGGLSLLRQGTPTNNTDDAGADYTAAADPDDSYALIAAQGGTAQPESDWFKRSDGQWLADLLGLDLGFVQGLQGAAHHDVRDAQAMNIALFPATIGYFMDTMLAEVFDDNAIEFVRQFFTRFVSGRGMISSLRIGKQPYGILPTSVYSRLQWRPRSVTGGLSNVSIGGAGAAQLSKLYEVLMRAYGVWGNLKQKVAYVGKSGDPHQILLDVLGLHPTSVEFDQRYAESLQQVINSLNIQGLLERLLTTLGLFTQGMNVLQDHGYDLNTQPRPDLLDKYFFAKPYAVNPENLIHDMPLSETEGIRAYTTDQRNYIEWLQSAGRTSLEAVRTQAGFDKTPTALLYIMLRHALMLGYHDTGLRLTASLRELPASTVQQMRRESSFIHISQGAKNSESRYRMLYDSGESVLGVDTNLNVADYIVSILNTAGPTARLNEQLAALERLQNLPSAHLERAFVEHLDTCTYRLDAWLQGLVAYNLSVRRFAGSNQQVNKGLYLGAYGWLEDVRPTKKIIQPVTLEDTELNGIFNRPDEPQLMRDSDNSGYIHTPSLNHAVTAAVLRNGYRHSATATDPGVFSVNLSSERVRRAMAIIQGMHNGQSLGELLGYQFERGLHDRHNEAEVDQFIYKLRKEFPLVADRMADTASDATTSIEAIEARNVLDGVALSDHIQTTGNRSYPFGKAGLPTAGSSQKQAIDKEVERLLDTHDAVSDLGIAEGIHQVVQGNYDRAAASVEAFASGELPPIPDVVQTPRSGIGLTHRVGLHLQPGLGPTTSPMPFAATPRASAEPAINAFLAGLLPAPDQTGVMVHFSDGSGASGQQIVTQQDLSLQPIDLLYMLNVESEQAMSALDDCIVRHVRNGKRPDTQVTILYTQRIPPRYGFFELAALMNELRGLLLEARPLRASDIALPNESSPVAQPLPEYHTNRLTFIRDQLSAPADALATLQGLVDELAPLLDDMETNRNNLVANIDDRLNRLVSALARLNSFGLPQTGYGFAMEWKRQRYNQLLSKVRDLLNRWADKLNSFSTMLAEYNALPVSSTAETRFALLAAMEALIAVEQTVPAPGTDPADHLTFVLNRQAAFTTKHDQFNVILSTSTQDLSALLALIESVAVNLDTFDILRLKLKDDANEILLFCEDIHKNALSALTEATERISSLNDHLTEYAATTTAQAREKAFNAAAHALLGNDFMVVPEFQFNPTQASEIKNAHDSQATLLDHVSTTLAQDFPVDDWLYGVARVRNMMQRWEAVTMLSEAVGSDELGLHPIQLPYLPDDRWLALPYPPDLLIDTDKLLYTAHYSVAFDKDALQCGLLLDEWTELLPTKEETSGIAFHYDRPNSEPPQVMLLVTSPQLSGRWQWADLVDTLHETLELAKRRAVEPDHIASTEYARFLPATISAVTFHPITIALNYALVNEVYGQIQTDGNNA